MTGNKHIVLYSIVVLSVPSYLAKQSLPISITKLMPECTKNILIRSLTTTAQDMTYLAITLYSSTNSAR